MNNSIKLAALALVIAATSFSGCKKGTDDPFLSLKSRKSRVAGDWKASAGTGTMVDGSSSTTTTWTFTDPNLVTTVGTFPAVTETYSFTLSIMTDGTYKSVETTTIPSNTQTVTEEGFWNFTGRIGEDKNKDHLVLKAKSQITQNSSTSSITTYTWTGDDMPSSVWYLQELKSKEMIVSWDGSSTSGSPASTDTDKGSWTFVQ